jgi:hypothetical protein
MVGQINRGSQLGDIIYDMCNQDDIKTIVEIGTWNGMGTTKCIYDSIMENNKKDYLVYSLESNPEFYNQAVVNLPKIKNFNIILGRIIEIEDLINIDECDDKFFIPKSNKEIIKGWFVNDIHNYKLVDNVLNNIPSKIDLLILDGGEFSSLAEFNKLKDRSTYFILDDTLLIKNNEVANIIRNDRNYQILYDNISDRNGFLISKKIS